MTHVLNHLPKEYDVILDGLKNCLTVSVDDALTIEIIHEKWNHWYKKLKTKMKKKEKKKRLQEPEISIISKDAVSVVSMVTNLVTINVQ